MASSDAKPVPKKNTAFRAYFPLLDTDGDLITGAAGLDSEVSIDGAAFADCTNEATEIGASGMWYLDLTAAEMNGDGICVVVKSDGSWRTTLVIYPEETGDIRVDVTAISGDPVAADNAESFFDGTGYNGANNVIPTVTTLTNLPAITAGWLTATGIAAGAFTSAKFDTGAINANALAADAASEIATAVATALGTGSGFSAIPWNASWDAEVQSEVQDALVAYDPPTNAEMEARTLLSADYATSTILATVAGYLDTEIAAIKAKTDNLPSDPADASDIASSFTTVNTTLSTIAGYIDTEVGAIKTKTDQLTFGTANRVNAQVYGIENNAITDAAISTPAETAGRPSTILAMIRRIWEKMPGGNKHTRDRNTGAVAVRNAADSGNLETHTQSTSGTVDTETQGS